MGTTSIASVTATSSSCQETKFEHPGQPSVLAPQRTAPYAAAERFRTAIRTADVLGASNLCAPRRPQPRWGDFKPGLHRPLPRSPRRPLGRPQGGFPGWHLVATSLRRREVRRAGRHCPAELTNGGLPASARRLAEAVVCPWKCKRSHAHVGCRSRKPHAGMISAWPRGRSGQILVTSALPATSTPVGRYRDLPTVSATGRGYPLVSW